MSSLFPHLSTCVDDLTFIKSMAAKSNNHTPATFQMNTGLLSMGSPAWVLGSAMDWERSTTTADLVVLPDTAGLPAGGSINWTAGFLPASHQGVAFRTQSKGEAD